MFVYIYNFINISKDFHHHHHHHLVNATSGKWLDALPTQQDFVIDSQSFQTCMRFRLMIPTLDSNLHHRCHCKRSSGTRDNQTTCNPTIDPFGHHLINCATGGFKINRHNHIASGLNRIIRQYGGSNTRQEELGLFVAHNTQDRLRPDITARDYLGTPSTMLIDVSVVASLTLNVHGEIMNKVTDVIGAPRVIMTKAKLKKYQNVSNANGFKFTPFIMETSGLVHTDAVNMLKKIAHHCSKIRKIPEAVLLNYFLKVLSCRLQCCFGTTITHRLHSLHGGHVDHSTYPGLDIMSEN